jgi:WD40 repeat protein
MLTPLLLAASAAVAAGDETPPNFADHVSPVLRENCVSCHRGSRARNGLDLRSVKAILKGGSAGPAVVPGDSSGSLLYQVIAHTAEPFMPPDEDALDPSIAKLVADWIDGGARVDANDTGVRAEAAPAEVIAPPLPSGVAPMPEGVPTQPAWWTPRGGVVTAVAVSPGAPLAAVAGYRQVSLYGLPGGELLGVLPFAPGQVHSLRFSAGGETLVAGGGRSADSGKAVAYDVATGRAWLEVGDEPDVALDADVSADLGRVALGGPDRTLRVYVTSTGTLAYEGGGHTDWITAVAFSPDGVLVASADRAGGVFVREALTGEEFHRLPAVDGGVTSLSWRADSMVLAAAGEGGKVALFEMENGKRIQNFGVGSGVLGLHYGRSGAIASAGRDGRFRLHDGAGKRRAQLGPAAGPAVCAAISGDGQWLVGGDSDGGVHVIEVASQETRAVLRAFPATDEERTLAAATAAADRAASELEAAASAVGTAEAAASTRSKELEAATRAAAEARARADGARDELEKARAARASAEDAAAGFGPVLQRWAADRDAARAEAAAARGAAESAEAALAERVAELDLAQLRRAEARGADVAAAEASLAAAMERMEGATARLQLAAGALARAEVLVGQREAQLGRWRERAEPRLAAAAEAGRLHDAAVEREGALTAAAEAEAGRAKEMESACGAAQAALEGARAAHEAAEAAAAEAGTARQRAASAWEARRADLERSGGEVRALGEA